jgi:hypothetical protein
LSWFEANQSSSINYRIPILSSRLECAFESFRDFVVSVGSCGLSPVPCLTSDCIIGRRATRTEGLHEFRYPDGGFSVFGTNQDRRSCPSNTRRDTRLCGYTGCYRARQRQHQCEPNPHSWYQVNGQYARRDPTSEGSQPSYSEDGFLVSSLVLSSAVSRVILTWRGYR